MPGIGGNIYSNPLMRNNINMAGRNNSSKSNQQQQQPNFYPSAQPSTQPYNMYPQNKSQGPMPPPLLQDNVMNPGSFNAQSPVSPSFNIPNQSVGPGLPPAITQASNPGPMQAPFGYSFDPSDPALFNFDLASMNFGNHYGALEFGMLGHMATGAGETPPSDSTTVHRGSTGHGSQPFTTPITGTSNLGESPSTQNYVFGDAMIGDWPNGQGAFNQNMMPHHQASAEVPHAFAIETGPGSFASPSSTTSPEALMGPFEDSPTAFKHSSTRQQERERKHPKISTETLKSQNLAKKRPRDPSAIYETVKEPYPYTTGFHGLTAFLQRRFSPLKTLRIAKALASIRPSFISCTKTLTRDDLIFMEKCFQRTLWEYEDFINACGTPTIVCRRTGEVAAVGKEFSILTGWKKDILLGKEANLNVNTGGTSGQPGTGASSRGGFNTPRMPTGDPGEPGRPQPVFLAELLDDESVIEFYEDFARLAFGDSRGSVTTRCKLLKYKTKDDPMYIKDDLTATDIADDQNAQGKGSGNDNDIVRNQIIKHSQKRNVAGQMKVKGGIAGEAGMNQLGFKDGKVDCTYCWTVKRDVFDIPMLIVMNVSCLSLSASLVLFGGKRLWSSIGVNVSLVPALYLGWASRSVVSRRVSDWHCGTFIRKMTWSRNIRAVEKVYSSCEFDALDLRCRSTTGLWAFYSKTARATTPYLM
jgi:hypothetical protein